MRLTITLSLLLLLGVVAAIAPGATASQVQGHLYVARAMSMQNPTLDAYLVGDRDAAFRWGAVAPDTLWITYIRTSWLRAQLLGFVNKNMAQHPGLTSINDTHNEPGGKSLDLCLSMMREASTSYEGAYALGWVTHWITDSYVHDLINTWGGYFHATGPDMFRHKSLEALECKHVLSAHADVVKSRTCYLYLLDKDCAGQIGATGRWATNLVLKAFRANFPDSPCYTVEADTFLKAFAIDEQLVQRGSAWFYKESTFKTLQEQCEAKAKLSAVEQDLVKDLVDLPTEDVYQQILNPFALVVTTGDGKLNLQIDVADTKMYGRFLLEWEANTQAAIEKSQSIIPACVAYIKAHPAYMREPASAPGHAEKGKQLEADLQAIGTLLTDINPNREMDLPRKDYKQRRPPNLCFAGSEGSGTDFSRLYFFTNLFWDCEMAKTEGGAPTRQERLSIPLNPTRKLSASEIIKVVNDIVLVPARGAVSTPIPGGKSEGTCKVTVYTSTNRLKEKVDFVLSDGAASTAQGEVMLGDIFDVQVPLPPGAAGNSWTQRWIIVQENDRFCYTDLPIIRDSGFDLIPTLGSRFRFDGQVIEQQTRGNTLFTKVQFTAMDAPTLLGHQTLTLVCIPDKVGTQEQACEVDTMWTIQSGTNMTADQASQLLRMMDTFKEQMKGKGLKPEEETVLINERFTIFKKSLGVDVGPLDMRQISSTKPIVLVQPLLRYAIPSGWKTNDWGSISPLNGGEFCIDGPQTGPQTCILTREETVKGSDGKSILLSTKSCLYGRFGTATRKYNDAQLEAQVKSKWPSPTRTYKVTTANGFSGSILEMREDKATHTDLVAQQIGMQREDSLGINVSGGGLLRKGKEYLVFTYSSWSSADKLVVFENHKYDEKTHAFVSSDRRDIGDGRNQSKQAIATAIADIDAVLAGLKLVKDPAFKLQPSRLFVPGPISATPVAAGDEPTPPGVVPTGDAEPETTGGGDPDVTPQPPTTPETATPPGKTKTTSPASTSGPSAPPAPSSGNSEAAAGKSATPPPGPAAATQAAPEDAPTTPVGPAKPVATPPSSTKNGVATPKPTTSSPPIPKPSAHPSPASSLPDTTGGANPSPAEPPASVDDAPLIPVKQASTSMEVLTSKATCGDVLRVKLVDPPKDKLSWIGFYKKDADHKDYIKYSFLNNLDGNTYEDVIAPDEEGEYNFRVFRDESYVPLAISDTLDIKARH